MGDEADAMDAWEMSAFGADFEPTVYRYKLIRNRNERPIHFTKSKRTHPTSPRKKPDAR